MVEPLKKDNLQLPLPVCFGGVEVKGHCKGPDCRGVLLCALQLPALGGQGKQLVRYVGSLVRQEGDHVFLNTELSLGLF